MNEWIPVQREMPPSNVRVLVFPGWATEGADIDEWWDDLGQWCSGVEDGWRPTHWMPLPSPPKEPQ